MKDEGSPICEMRRLEVEHDQRLKKIRMREIVMNWVLWLVVAGVIFGPFIARYLRGNK